MFCMNCGAKLPDGAKFCMSCGCKLGVVAPTPEENVVQARGVSNQNVKAEKNAEQPEKPLSRMEKLQRAAEAGNVMAQVNLADALMNGRGCEKDEQKALAWYKEAAEQGDDDAKAALEQYEKQQKQLAEEKEKAELQESIEDFKDFIGKTSMEMQQTAALTFFMMESNNVHVKDCVDYELLNNAINAYAFGVEPDDVELLVDDTVLSTSGSIGLVVTSKGIITSRMISVDFQDIDTIAVNGDDIDVTYKNGEIETIYTLDILVEEERKNLEKYLTAVVKLSK